MQRIQPIQRIAYNTYSAYWYSTCSAHIYLADTDDGVMPAVHGRVEEVVRGLLERCQHENGLSHLGHSEPRDPQHLSLGVEIVGSDNVTKHDDSEIVGSDNVTKHDDRAYKARGSQHKLVNLCLRATDIRMFLAHFDSCIVAPFAHKKKKKNSPIRV